MLPNCGHPWWTQPSTCFSSKWRLNWNRLKTNWSRPKMNWVPGNLHLIGKDNQNNSPLKKVKTSSRPPPSRSLQACRNNGGGEGWQMLYSPWDSDFTESQSLQNKTVFVLLHCASYISHNLRWKDSMVRWHLCFSSLPSYSLTVQGPEGVRTLPEEVVTHFPTWICPHRPLSSNQTAHI